jgi:hypothetical protein
MRRHRPDVAFSDHHRTIIADRKSSWRAGVIRLNLD